MPGCVFSDRLFRNHLPSFIAKFSYGFGQRPIFDEVIFNLLSEIRYKLNCLFFPSHGVEVANGCSASRAEIALRSINVSNRAVFPFLRATSPSLIGLNGSAAELIDRNHSYGGADRCNDSQNKNLFCLAHQKPPWLLEQPGCQYKNDRLVSQTCRADYNLLPIAH